MVYLVGAGPGDSGLITQKGLECIKKADVIIYDHLANPTLLSYAKNDCKLIYAGKIAGNHHMVQEEINKTLVKHSRFGNVVRLKGGDVDDYVIRNNTINNSVWGAIDYWTPTVSGKYADVIENDVCKNIGFGKPGTTRVRYLRCKAHAHSYRCGRPRGKAVSDQSSQVFG